MRKRILLLGYNFYPEPTGIGKYSGEMGKWLASNGFDCEVVAAYPYYPYWKVQAPYHADRFWYQTETLTTTSGAQLKVHRCPMYVPAEPSGLKRILLDFSFLFTAFFRVVPLLFKKKFDYVIVVVPSFQFGLLGSFYKKIRGAKFAYHIQDLQIEAARDLRMIKSPAVINALFGVEKYILRQSDLISSVGRGMIDRIQEKTTKPVYFFPNWTDVAAFYPIADKGPLKQQFGLAPTDTVLLYSGAIGEKQGLEAILYAAQEFRARPELKFVICGSGPYREKLQGLAAQLRLDNVRFLPLQPVEQFNHFLNMADVHLIIQKANAGDLVMPSKLTTVLAVGGLALITAEPGSGMYALVREHRMGLLVPAENQPALNAGIRAAVAAPHADLRQNARHYAEQHLALDSVMQAYVEQLAQS